MYCVCYWYTVDREEKLTELTTEQTQIRNLNSDNEEWITGKSWENYLNVKIHELITDHS